MSGQQEGMDFRWVGWGGGGGIVFLTIGGKGGAIGIDPDTRYRVMTCLIKVSDSQKRVSGRVRDGPD